ncbi:hypothetical protein CPB85DRAFT_1280291 [Mucidula mucida]|nr:hypothetical protein CPB85DRAFT_1280291 [Mucidula mucida]
MDPSPEEPRLAAQFARLSTSTMILRRINYFISDAVVIWRTWTIYYDNVYVRAYLAIVLLATGATSIATAIITLRIHDFTVTNMLGSVCLLLTNFSTILLCAYKVWHYRRVIKATFAGRTGKSLVENVLLVLVESGSLYCIFWVSLCSFCIDLFVS